MRWRECYWRVQHTPVDGIWYDMRSVKFNSSHGGNPFTEVSSCICCKNWLCVSLRVETTLSCPSELARTIWRTARGEQTDKQACRQTYRLTEWLTDPTIPLNLFIWPLNSIFILLYSVIQNITSEVRRCPCSSRQTHCCILDGERIQLFPARHLCAPPSPSCQHCLYLWSQTSKKILFLSFI